MWNLIIAFEDTESWNVTQHPGPEAAISARERFLKAQRIAILNDMADATLGKRRNRPGPVRKRVKWTAIARVK